MASVKRLSEYRDFKVRWRPEDAEMPALPPGIRSRPAARAWAAYWRSGVPQYLAIDPDESGIVQWITLYAEVVRLKHRVARQVQLYPEKPDPLYRRIKDAEQELRYLREEFVMTPQARRRAGLPLNDERPRAPSGDGPVSIRRFQGAEYSSEEAAGGAG